MAAKDKDKKNGSTFGPAAEANISLSQMLLGPLDAIFKAQIHSARSFLNMVLQMGYPHEEVDERGEAKKPTGATNADGSQNMYLQRFAFKTKDASGNEKTMEISVPALALIPIAPLAVEDAEFEFEFKVKEIGRHRQMQKSELSKLEKEKPKGFHEGYRPWFLVSEPVSLRGSVASSSEDEKQKESEGRIKVKIRINKQAMPAGLDKMLTTMHQLSKMEEKT